MLPLQLSVSAGVTCVCLQVSRELLVLLLQQAETAVGGYGGWGWGWHSCWGSDVRQKRAVLSLLFPVSSATPVQVVLILLSSLFSSHNVCALNE